MKKIGLVLLSLFISLSIQAEDKLDLLDKQSKEFFKAITGLEKDYLQEQIKNIKEKADRKVVQGTPDGFVNEIQQVQTVVQENKVSQEDYEKTVFEHENEMARLTTDFTRTKKIKDIKIKSMYSFNDNAYVVLKLEEESTSTTSTDDGDGNELSLNIEGRYKKGDYILTHKIVNINTRTKTVELYKKLDDEYGYSIYLSNYGISVSDLKKRPKEKTKKIEKVEKKLDIQTSDIDIKKVFQNVSSNTNINTSSNDINNCVYTVLLENLNVRENNNLNARILRVLKKGDKFTIQNKIGKWAHIDTIYKKESGDEMNVKSNSNWTRIIRDDLNIVSFEEKNCL